MIDLTIDPNGIERAAALARERNTVVSTFARCRTQVLSTRR